jgi:hypothetical protein
VTQEWYFLDPKFALAKFGILLILSQMLKHDSKVFFMLFHTFQIYQNVVDEHYDKLVQLRHEIEFMRYMKCAGTFVHPKDMIRYS